MSKDYIVAGFYEQLLEPWVAVADGDEWGEYVYAMHMVINRSMSWTDERTLVVCEWLLEEIDRANQEEWFGVFYDYDDWVRVYEAQDTYEDTVKYWRERAASFESTAPGCVAALEEVIAKLPGWVKPQSNRLPKPDKEREMYEKLKAKFENL